MAHLERELTWLEPNLLLVLLILIRELAAPGERHQVDITVVASMVAVDVASRVPNTGD